MENKLFELHPELEVCRKEISDAVDTLTSVILNGGKILICGNGGSAADCEHISGELLKGFMSKRPVSDEIAVKIRNSCKCADDAEKLIKTLQMGIPAIPLPSLSAICTAYANDCDADLVFAQEVFALGKKDDVLIGLSTSGNSKNVIYAFEIAKSMGMKTVALTGEGGGKAAELADICVKVPANETYLIQEYHLPVYHYICAEIEKKLFG